MSGSDALQEEMEQRLLSCKVFPLDNPVKFENALGILVLDVVFVPLAWTSVPKGRRNTLENKGKEKVKCLNCLVPPPTVDFLGFGRT